MNLAQLV